MHQIRRYMLSDNTDFDIWWCLTGLPTAELLMNSCRPRGSTDPGDRATASAKKHLAFQTRRKSWFLKFVPGRRGKKSRRASAAEAAAGGEALVGPSRRPRIDLGSKVRPDRNSSRSYAPRVTAPPHTLHSRSRRARRPGSPRGPRTQGWPTPGGRRQVNGGPPPGGGAWRSGRDPRPPSPHSPRPPSLPQLPAPSCPNSPCSLPPRAC
ncbi:proline-rich protein 2-like [Lagenorhynchus albirostris]|uniref:proline-rich protein 2-like n=1 Tax=Lagenorhynchus albirostris TaxID=27610 RepID=UPI0028F06884|nr:proline-rich protein 2-like [Lagenorhynchus albirostris]